MSEQVSHLTHPSTPTANTEVKLPLNFSRDVRESPQATCDLTVRSLAFPPLLALTLLWCPRSEEIPPICLSFFQAFIMLIKRGVKRLHRHQKGAASAEGPTWFFSCLILPASLGPLAPDEQSHGYLLPVMRAQLAAVHWKRGVPWF